MRLEVSASQSKNDIEQNFTGIEYLDGRPPMSFYSSRQDVNHFDTVAVGRLHAGADYEVNGRTLLGAKLTYSLVDDIADTGGLFPPPDARAEPRLHQSDHLRCHTWLVAGRHAQAPARPLTRRCGLRGTGASGDSGICTVKEETT